MGEMQPRIFRKKFILVRGVLSLGSRMTYRKAVLLNALMGGMCWSAFLAPYLYYAIAKEDYPQNRWLFYTTATTMGFAVAIYVVLAIGATCKVPALVLVYLVAFPILQLLILVQAVILAVGLIEAENGRPKICREISSKGFSLPPDCEDIRRYQIYFVVCACLYALGLVLAIFFWNRARQFRNEVLFYAKSKKLKGKGGRTIYVQDWSTRTESQRHKHQNQDHGRHAKLKEARQLPISISKAASN